jgi:cellobiose-specific phosphotransferase system component IIA
MYKLLFFLHKSDDDSIPQHFKEITIKHLSKITGEEVKIAKVDNNLLQDEKYSYFCEISASSQHDMDKMMNTKAGKDLNKDLMEFHKNISVIPINYGTDN